MNAARALTIATLGAVLSALFVAVRGPLPVSAFFVVAAATALMLAALLSAVWRSGFALRGALVGLGLSTAPLYVLGKVLKATTHHRPLGAVTFAFVALFVMAAAVSLGLRIVAARSESAWARVVSLGFEVAGSLAVATASIRVLRDAAIQGGAVDAAFALGASAVLALVPLPERVRSAAERVGPWVWGGLVLVGLGFALGPARVVASASSPALTAALAWF